MLDILTAGFQKANDRLKGRTFLTEDNISESLNDIRTSLLEADVAYSVAKTFLERVKEKSLGQKVKFKIFEVGVKP